MQKYREENEQLAKRLTELESFTSKNESEKEKMRGKLAESVRLLKEFKS
jgi:CHASE3 domain sensor protein